jgi:predicted GNAT family acetyltransferase
MSNLMQANNELFRRSPDERFESLVELWQHCFDEQKRSVEHWPQPQELTPYPEQGRLDLRLNGSSSFRMTDWSFSQLCKLAGVSKDTVNRLQPETAGRVFGETLSPGSKPLQVYAADDVVRSIHGASYTRLYNVDLLTMVREFATDFVPPQKAGDGSGDDDGGTGLYCGEQDMFCFLIDPTGWAEINGEAFAPGFFVWNSEVGKRSVGVQTFWFQAVCQNHIVWDAVEVVDFSRKHTANVYESVAEIRGIIARLVEKRDERRDGFVQVVKKAMETRLGSSSDEVLKVLAKQGITRTLAKEALEVARTHGAFTIFAVVDALTRISGKLANAGERSEVDQKASALLSLAK